MSEKKAGKKHSDADFCESCGFQNDRDSPKILKTRASGNLMQPTVLKRPFISV